MHRREFLCSLPIGVGAAGWCPDPETVQSYIEGEAGEFPNGADWHLIEFNSELSYSIDHKAPHETETTVDIQEKSSTFPRGYTVTLTGRYWTKSPPVKFHDIRGFSYSPIVALIDGTENADFEREVPIEFTVVFETQAKPSEVNLLIEYEGD